MSTTCTPSALADLRRLKRDADAITERAETAVRERFCAAVCARADAEGIRALTPAAWQRHITGRLVGDPNFHDWFCYSHLAVSDDMAAAPIDRVSVFIRTTCDGKPVSTRRISLAQLLDIASLHHL